MLLGNTTCCALVYSSSSSVLCLHTPSFSQGSEAVEVLICRDRLSQTQIFTESCNAETWLCLHFRCKCSDIFIRSIQAVSRIS